MTETQETNILLNEILTTLSKAHSEIYQKQNDILKRIDMLDQQLYYIDNNLKNLKNTINNQDDYALVYTRKYV